MAISLKPSSYCLYIVSVCTVCLPLQPVPKFSSELKKYLLSSVLEAGVHNLLSFLVRALMEAAIMIACVWALSVLQLYISASQILIATWLFPDPVKIQLLILCYLGFLLCACCTISKRFWDMGTNLEGFFMPVCLARKSCTLGDEREEGRDLKMCFPFISLKSKGNRAPRSLQTLWNQSNPYVPCILAKRLNLNYRVKFF